MKYITGQDRSRIPLFESSIEAAIAADYEVRMIDLFVVYNLRRIKTIIGFDGLKKWLGNHVFRFFEPFFEFLLHTITNTGLPKTQTIFQPTAFYILLTCIFGGIIN